MAKVVEIIPDNIPEWAKEAMADGQLFRVAIERSSQLETCRGERGRLKKALEACREEIDCHVAETEKAEAERDKLREALTKIGGHHEGNEKVHHGNLQALVHHLVEIAQQAIKEDE